MKISAAALPFLILAAAHGTLAFESPAQELSVVEPESLRRRFLQHDAGPHRPIDCCFSYVSRNIRCVFMKSYYETSSACPLPAVVFITKRGRKVCANPQSEGVQECMLKLGPA